MTPVYSDTNALSKSYFKPTLQIVREFLRKCLFFKTQKVAVTGYYDIEDPLPDVILKLHHFREGCEVPIVGCQEPFGSQNADINAKEATTIRGKLR